MELLKAAARVGRRTDGRGITTEALTFVLSYGREPDVETERTRMEDLLGASGFDLTPYGEDEPSVLVLQFTGVPRRQSSAYLFETAGELEEALGLDAVLPEVAPAWDDGAEGRGGTEDVGDAVGRLCRSSAKPPADPDWARRMVKSDRASERFGVDGTGILIGQPDTGVAEHVELTGALALDKAWNVIADSADATDPLSARMGAPGHGTATASCVISRSPGTVTGTAPGARLAPIRCINSVIIGSGIRVARAIDHARRAGCDVVTMSLGGPIYDVVLARAIARAVKAGVIVMAAAGNCVGFVVYPARFSSVIAVAGVDENRRLWKGSSRGRRVDVAAPGENLHVARRAVVAGGATPTPEDLRRIGMDAQGTSFAVATTAGVAALWLQHHGRDAVRDEARRRGTSVQELFRAAMRRTASPPASSERGLGAGVVDAEALCALPLDGIPQADEIETAPLASRFFDIEGMGARLRAEAEMLAADWRLRAQPEGVRGAHTESALPPQPSPALCERLKSDARPPAAPPFVTAPLTPPMDPTWALRTLGALADGASPSRTDVTRAQAALREKRHEIVATVERRLNASPCPARSICRARSGTGSCATRSARSSSSARSTRPSSFGVGGPASDRDRGAPAPRPSSRCSAVPSCRPC